MVRKTSWFMIPAAALGLLAASQWQDVKRYLKIRQISEGQGHPENVPAGGSTGYPHDASGSAAEGTGDFDSASRGGPKT